jgi:uncharacterized protein YbjQ (UPF0145 family)
MDRYFEVIVPVAFPLLLLFIAYFSGRAVERRHYASIREREVRWQNFPAVTFRTVPPGWQVAGCALATGNVVVSVDYFKRFLSGLRMIFGGRVKAYESLLDRARREALLRLKENAVENGYHALINVRLETSRMANAKGSEGAAGVEVLAFGTALKLHNIP